jgi:tricorn protease
MRNGFVVTSLAFLFAAMPARAQVDARMFRYPDVSDTHITFVYAGDIWVVEKNGGTARRLSSPPGEELFPRFSPDGRRIAFSGNYDGNTDVYVIPAMGGETVRVTHHPDADRLLDWTPDGTRLLFASPRESGVRRFNQLYLVSPDGGLPQKLPAPYGEFGTLSPDGGSLAYMPKTRDFRNWKRYRGGMAPDIWLLDLESLDAQNVSSSDANDGHPMWHGKTLYFLSDRGPEQRSNIWALETVTNQMRAVTRFPDVDVTFPAIGPSNMVFQAGGRLYLLDLAMEGYRKVDVDVVTDLATLRPRSENVSELIECRCGHRPRYLAAALRECERAHRDSEHLTERQARRLRGPRRDLHRTGKARGRQEHHTHLGSCGALCGLVTGWQAHRLLE